MGAVKYLKIGNGFLWKPEAGGRAPGKLAVLLPTNMKAVKSKYVRIFANGVKVETLTFSSFFTEGDDRQIWRAKKPGKAYPKPCEVRTQYKGKVYGWKIKDPSKRNE